MAKADGAIYINTKINSDGMETGGKEIKNAVKSIVNILSEINTTLKSFSGEIGKSFSDAGNQIDNAASKAQQANKEFQKLDDTEITITYSADVESSESGSGPLRAPVELDSQISREWVEKSKEATEYTNQFAENMASASKSANTLISKIKQLKTDIKEMEGQGLGPGDESYDRAIKNLSILNSQLRSYTKQMALGAQADIGSFGSLESKILEVEQTIEYLKSEGLGIETSEMQEALKTLAELKEAYKNLYNEAVKTDSMRQKEAKALAATEAKAAEAAEKAAQKELATKIKAIQAAQKQQAAEAKRMIAQQAAAAKAEAAAAELEAKEREAAEEAERLRSIYENASVSNSYIARLKNELSDLKARQAELSKAGIGLGYAEFDSNTARIAKINQSLREYEQNLTTSEKKTNVFASGLKKIAGVAKSAAQKILGLGNNTKKNNSVLNSGLKKILAYGLGIQSLYVLFNKMRSATIEGMQNLAQYSGTTNASLSSLKSALTQLKNSLATAFAPILNVVAPILTTFINLISKAVTYVGMLFAALTGQKTFTKAVAVQESYASAAQDTADATNAANEANEDYLSGLDEVTKWEDKASSGGSGGGGGGTGGVDPSQMFEEVEIPSLFDDLAAKMKAAWESADFTEIGTIVGTKLKESLENIPWDGIKKAAEKIAKSTATFINGFIETPGLWQTVGKTIAQGFNTALTFLVTFLDTVHWDSVGSAITTALQSAVQNVDFKLIGHVLSSALIAGLNFGKGLIQGIDWRQVPKDIVNGIKDAINGFDFKGAFTALGGLLGAGVKAGIGLIQGLGDIGADIIEGIMNGGVDFIKGIPKWIKENILKPFIDGFKSAFDIHSPSKNPDILSIGKNIILGMLNGMIEGIANIGTWIKEKILKPIQEALANPIDTLKNAGKALWNTIMPNTDDNKLTLTVTAVKDKAFELVQSGWESIKDKTSTLTAKAKNAKSKILTTLQNGWETVKTKTSKLTGEATSSNSNVLSTLISAWDFIRTKTERLIGETKNNNPNVLSTLKSAWQTITTKTSVLTGNSVNSNSSVLSTLKSSWDTITNKTSILTGKTINNNANTLLTLRDSWKDISNKTATLTGKTTNSNASVLATIQTAWKNISNKTATLTGKSINSNSGTLSTLKSYWGSITSKTSTLTAKTNNYNSGTLSTVKSAWGTIVTKTVTLTAKIAASATGIIKALLGLQTGGIYKNGHWQSIEGYASGGNPKKARLFYANENGIPELVGRIGSNTAVMNNGQIVASVAAGVYRAVVAAFGQLSNYFASMSIAMSNVPKSLDYLTATISTINLAPPIMATGTVIPPAVSIDTKSIDDLQQTITDLKNWLDNINVNTPNGGNQGGTYEFVAQINRRTIFDEIISEAKLRQMNNGKNPFELA